MEAQHVVRMIVLWVSIFLSATPAFAEEPSLWLGVKENSEFEEKIIDHDRPESPGIFRYKTDYSIVLGYRLNSRFKIELSYTDDALDFTRDSSGTNLITGSSGPSPWANRNFGVTVNGSSSEPYIRSEIGAGRDSRFLRDTDNPDSDKGESFNIKITFD